MANAARAGRSADGADRLLTELEDRAVAHGSDPLRVAMARERAELGATILTLRVARGLSQAELSRLSGVEQADISRIERAATDPRASTILRLLAGLDARLVLELADDLGSVAPR